MRLALIALAVCSLAMPAACTTMPAYAHGEAEWIQRGQYKNGANELCCGEHDCAVLSDGDVSRVSAGYFIKSLNETVPYSEAKPSQDGQFWRCAWGSGRKCFFVPPES